MIALISYKGDFNRGVQWLTSAECPNIRTGYLAHIALCVYLRDCRWISVSGRGLSLAAVSGAPLSSYSTWGLSWQQPLLALWGSVHSQAGRPRLPVAREIVLKTTEHCGRKLKKDLNKWKGVSRSWIRWESPQIDQIQHSVYQNRSWLFSFCRN